MSGTASCEWTVTGMDCASCAGKVRGAVERLPGVSDVDVALMAERLRLRLDEEQTPRERVEAAVKALGFGIAPKGAAIKRKGFVLPDGAFRWESLPRAMPKRTFPLSPRLMRPSAPRDGTRRRRADW